MNAIGFNLSIHLLGEPRYRANCTLVAAHGSVASMDGGEGREPGAASFATPWNRITIPRHCASPKAPTVGALHHHKRTLHPVQLLFLD